MSTPALPSVVLTYSDYGLRAEIETTHLSLKSVENTPAEIQNYRDLCLLYEDYSIGDVPHFDEVAGKVECYWVNRWQRNNPFSAFSIYQKGEKESPFVGFISLDRLSHGRFHLNAMGKKEAVEKGYASEAILAIVETYISFLKKRALCSSVEIEVSAPLTLQNMKFFTDHKFTFHAKLGKNNQQWGIFVLKV